MTKHLGFAPLPYGGGNASDIDLSGWARVTPEQARIEERAAGYERGEWNTSFECHLWYAKKEAGEDLDAWVAEGMPEFLPTTSRLTLVDFKPDEEATQITIGNCQRNPLCADVDEEFKDPTERFLSPDKKSNVDYKRTRHWYCNNHAGLQAADVPMTIEFCLDSYPVLTFHEDGRVVGSVMNTPDEAADAILGLVEHLWGKPLPEHHWSAMRATERENNTERFTCLPVGHKLTDQDGYKLTWNGDIYTLDEDQDE